jgi:predicted TIM-barrel fold metal-dependent hydrolase
MIPLISLEEHFFTSHISDWSTYGYGEQFKWLPGLLNKLLDFDTTRLESMNANSIAIQVLSHAPGLGTASLSDCKQANDDMYVAIQRHPTRYAGFAVLPMGEPELAAEELRRCVKEMGFKGALVDNHVKGKHYEGKAYRVFWETVQDLDVPVYLHPTWPAKGVQTQQYEGEISEGAIASLGSSGWGWHSDVGRSSFSFTLLCAFAMIFCNIQYWRG